MTIIADTLEQNKISACSVDETFDMYSLIYEIIDDVPEDYDDFSILLFENPIKVTTDRKNHIHEIININSSTDIKINNDV